jgi:hypothetical protein
VAAWLVTIGLVLISILNVWSLTLGGQYYAPDTILNPLIKYSWPRLLAGDVARNWGMILGLRGVVSVLPLLMFIIGAVVSIWLVTRTKGEPQYVKTVDTH